jgi:hypothetical protein
MVKRLLTERPELRDDDRRLIANIYVKEAGGVSFLRNISKGKIIFIRLYFY